MSTPDDDGTDTPPDVLSNLPRSRRQRPTARRTAARARRTEAQAAKPAATATPRRKATEAKPGANGSGASVGNVAGAGSGNGAPASKAPAAKATGPKAPAAKAKAPKAVSAGTAKASKTGKAGSAKVSVKSAAKAGTAKASTPARGSSASGTKRVRPPKRAIPPAGYATPAARRDGGSADPAAALGRLAEAGASALRGVLRRLPL